MIHNDGAEVTEEVKEFSSEKLTVIDYPCKYSASEAISRARSKLGNEWELLTNNCERGQRMERVRVSKCLVELWLVPLEVQLVLELV